LEQSEGKDVQERELIHRVEETSGKGGDLELPFEFYFC
jgi:hypothetical protein